MRASFFIHALPSLIVLLMILSPLAVGAQMVDPNDTSTTPPPQPQQVDPLQQAVPPPSDPPPPVRESELGGARPQQQTQTPEDLDRGGSAPSAQPVPTQSPQSRESVEISGKFTPLAGIPGITDLSDITLPILLQAMYRMLIVIGAVLAVLRIVLAGMTYMMSDKIGSTSKAKEQISSSLLGLLLLLSAVFILQIISGSAVSLNVLNGPPLNLTSLPAVDPLAVVPDTNKEYGCNQVAGSGKSCNSGHVGVMSGKKVQCADPEAVGPIPGQSAFKPVTERNCVLAGGDAIIRNGGLMHGQQEKTIAELEALYGNKSTSELLQQHAQSLQETCRDLSGSAQATVKGQRSTVFSPAVFTCSS